MRKNILILSALLVFGINNSYAQESGTKDSTKVEASDYKTIFKTNGNKPKVTGFGVVNMDFYNVSNNFVFNPGMDLAVLLNRSFYFGIYGRGMASFPTYQFDVAIIDSNQNETIDTRAMFLHGGLIVGGIFMPNKPIHFGLSTKFGVGGFMLIDNSNYNHQGSQNYQNNPTYYMAPLFVITPQLDIEMNINYWFKFRLGIGYQWVSNASINYNTYANGVVENKELINTSELSTPVVSFGLVFGWFK